MFVIKNTGKIGQELNQYWQYAVKRNSGLWFHILAGGYLAKFFMLVIPQSLNGSVSVLAWVLVVVSALLYEVLEYTIEYRADPAQIEAKYGSWERYGYDTIGDICGAAFAALPVVVLL